MRLTGEKLAKHLTRSTQKRFGLRQKEVYAMPHCIDKGYELRSAGKTHDSLGGTQGVLNLRHRLMRVMLKTRYSWIY